MWPFKKPSAAWQPPNAPLTEADFVSRGEFQMWQGVTALWERVSTLDGRVAKMEGTLLILVPLVIATFVMVLIQTVG